MPHSTCDKKAHLNRNFFICKPTVIIKSNLSKLLLTYDFYFKDQIAQVLQGSDDEAVEEFFQNLLSAMELPEGFVEFLEMLKMKGKMSCCCLRYNI